MNNFNHCIVNLRLFLCLLFVLVVISYLPFSSPSTVSGASSIFGYYFGSNIPGQPQPTKSNSTSNLAAPPPSNSTSNLAAPPPSNSTSNLAAPPPSNSTSNLAAPPPSNSTSNLAAP